MYYAAPVFKGDVVLRVVLSTFFGECFPTSYRATAQGVLAFFYYTGEVIALAIETELYSMFNNSHWPAVSLLCSLSFLCCPVILCFLPETSNKSLNDVSPESAVARGHAPGHEERGRGDGVEMSRMNVVAT
jgi:hypothetical protein